MNESPAGGDGVATYQLFTKGAGRRLLNFAVISETHDVPNKILLRHYRAVFPESNSRAGSACLLRRHDFLFNIQVPDEPAEAQFEIDRHPL